MPIMRITLRAGIGVLLLGVGPSTACAQKTAVPQDSLAIAQEAAQDFLGWYASKAIADEKVSAYWKVLTANQYLDDELTSALRADSVARANFRAETRDLLDMDPFLGGQDYCKLPPRTTGARRQGIGFVVSALTCVQSSSQTGGPSVDLTLLPINGKWRITNVTFGSRMNLKSYLCKLAQTDVDRTKRPTQCPP